MYRSFYFCDELYHHGIKGQRWGVRRFQNKDGSLTPEGIKRYKTDLKFKEKYDKSVAKRESKRVEKLMKKPLRKLSEAELAERINRLSLEKRAADVERELNAVANPKGKPNNNNGNSQGNAGEKAVAKGKSIASEILNATGKVIIGGIAKNVGGRIVDRIFGGDKETTKVVQEVAKDVKDTVDDLSGKEEKSNKKDKSKDKPLSGTVVDTPSYAYDDISIDPFAGSSWKSAGTSPKNVYDAFVDYGAKTGYKTAASSPYTDVGEEYVTKLLSTTKFY